MIKISTKDDDMTHLGVQLDTAKYLFVFNDMPFVSLNTKNDYTQKHFLK